MKIQFKTKIPKQLTAAEYWIDSITEELMYGGAKGGGKSFLGCSLIFGDALIYPETHYFIARKELNDLRKFTIPSIHEVFKIWGLNIETYAKYNGQDNCFNLHNGSKVFLIACKEEPSDPLFERFGSMQMTRGWIEEAGEVPESAKSNLWLSIGRWKNDVYNLKKKILITCNPKKGWLKRDFVVPFQENRLPINLKYIQAFATDNVYLTKDYLASLAGEKDKVRRQRLWEGNWDYDEDMDSLINSDALEDSFTNTIIKDGEKYLIIDVARQGRDTTVFSIFDGLELIEIQQYQKQGTEVTEQKAKDVAAKHQIPYSHILVDEDGIGGAIVDHLRGVKGFTANSTPILTASQIRERQNRIIIGVNLEMKPIYANLKAQCGWKLAEFINEHKIAFRVPEYREKIIEDLSATLRDKKVDSDGKKQLKSKEEVKEELGHSPDIGDTLIMRMWFELQKEALNIDPNEQKYIKRELETYFMKNETRMGLNSTK